MTPLDIRPIAAIRSERNELLLFQRVLCWWPPALEGSFHAPGKHKALKRRANDARRHTEDQGHFQQVYFGHLRCTVR